MLSSFQSHVFQSPCLCQLLVRHRTEPPIANCMSLLHTDKIPHWTSHYKLHVSLAYRQDSPLNQPLQIARLSCIQTRFPIEPPIANCMSLLHTDKIPHWTSHCKLHVFLAYRQDSPLNQPLQIARLSCIQTRFPIEPAIANCTSLLHTDKIPHWTSHYKLHVSLAYRQDSPLPTTGYLFECNEEMQVKNHLSQTSSLGPPDQKAKCSLLYHDPTWRTVHWTGVDFTDCSSLTCKQSYLISHHPLWLAYAFFFVLLKKSLP